MTEQPVHQPFIDAVMRHFDAESDASSHIGEYFDPATPFTGSMFEQIADHDRPCEITARDLVAVSMLGVEIPAPVAIWLLSEDGHNEVETLLRRVPDEVDIWEKPEILDRDGPLWNLWNLLNTACWPQADESNGMGRTKLSKLLAAKRPRLVPVTDSVVVEALPAVPSYWHAFRELLLDEDRRTTIDRATANAPKHLSTLRRIDVVLWMAHRRRA